MRTLKSLMSLSGRKALVTGGAGHIGEAACQALIELGATVAVLDRNERSCARRARALGKRSWPLPCDLSDEASTRGAAREAVRRMKGLDILVHAAAFVGDTKLPGWAVPFEKQSLAAWDMAQRVNVGAAFALAQEAKEALSASGRGSIILLSSTYGVVGPDFRIYEGTPIHHPLGYSASKGAVVQLTRALATALAPRVRVNALSPGGVKRGQSPTFVRRYESRTPLARMATEEDYKGAVAYLASDLSAYVTGQNLIVDGGWTAW